MQASPTMCNTVPLHVAPSHHGEHVLSACLLAVVHRTHVAVLIDAHASMAKCSHGWQSVAPSAQGLDKLLWQTIYCSGVTAWAA